MYELDLQFSLFFSRLKEVVDIFLFWLDVLKGKESSEDLWSVLTPHYQLYYSPVWEATQYYMCFYGKRCSVDNTGLEDMVILYFYCGEDTCYYV